MQFLKFILLIVFFTNLLYSSDPKFTKDELQWIKDAPTIKLGADYKWPPFDFADEEGKHTGLASEYIKLVSQKSGLKFEITTDIWSNVLKDAKLKKYDGLTCAVKTEERSRYLNFTSPYLVVPTVIVVNSDNDTIKSINDLNSLVVSVNKGSYTHEWLKTSYPKIKLHLSTSSKDSLEAVSTGKADAYLGNMSVATYVKNKYLLNNIKIINIAEGLDTKISMAVDKDNRMLYNIMEKSIKSITHKEHLMLRGRWENITYEDKKRVVFTKKELDWINTHKEIDYTGDPNWLPFEATDSDNRHIGIAAEYIKEIANYTGIHFRYVPSFTWLDAIKKINESKVSMIVETTNSKLDLHYTDPFISNSIVIVMNDSAVYVEELDRISDKKIAVIKEYGYVPKLKNEYKDIDFYEVENIQEGLSAVSTGKYDALLCTFALGSYTIAEMGLKNVKIVGKTKISTDVGFGIVDEYKPLVLIINKVLSTIEEKQKHEILNKWIYQKYVEKVDYTLLWQIIGIFLIFMAASLFWNRKLSAEIVKRKLAQKELFTLNKKLEEAMQSVQSANRAKSDFLSNMSHEIRTPMNSILGFAELLDEKIEDKKLKSFIKTIRSSGETLLHLINDILDLSKIESGKLKIVKTKVNIYYLLEEITDLFTLQAEKKGIRLELLLESNFPKSLLIDPIRLKEILINLVGNAIKFTDEGYVRVTVLADKVYEHTSKIDMRIKVQDSGIGIEKSDQENIFNMFEQTENQDIKKYGGTGLGLAISRKLARLMNGDLNVESHKEKGSIFILELKNIDIASIDDEQEEGSDYRDIRFNREVILIVDDIKENRELIKEIIEQNNLKYLEAVNGEEAVSAVKRGGIDLVLMDIRMPVMDGYTATRIIKEMSSVNVVALTASAMHDEMKKVEKEQFNGYLRKPISKNDLLKELAKHLKYSKDLKKEKVENRNTVFEDKDTLKEFLLQIDKKTEYLYHQAVLTNDITKIREFAQSLLTVSKELELKSMAEYSLLLIENIDSFEIDVINTMLIEYKDKIKELREQT